MSTTPVSIAFAFAVVGVAVCTASACDDRSMKQSSNSEPGGKGGIQREGPARRAETFSPKDAGAAPPPPSTPPAPRQNSAADVGERMGASVDEAAREVEDGVDRVNRSVGKGVARIGAGAARVGKDLKSDLVGGLELGRTLNTSGGVVDHAQRFAVGDAIVASFDTGRHAADGALTATLRNTAGKVIATDAGSLSADQQRASFRLGNAPAVGSYTVSISDRSGRIESQRLTVHSGL